MLGAGCHCFSSRFEGCSSMPRMWVTPALALARSSASISASTTWITAEQAGLLFAERSQRQKQLCTFSFISWVWLLFGPTSISCWVILSFWDSPWATTRDLVGNTQKRGQLELPTYAIWLHVYTNFKVRKQKNSVDFHSIRKCRRKYQLKHAYTIMRISAFAACSHREWQYDLNMS